MMVFEGITSEQRHLTASTLSWALAAHALQSKSSFSIALIYTIIHRNPVQIQGPKKEVWYLRTAAFDSFNALLGIGGPRVA